MKFLFVSYEGLIADTAWQVTKEGHETKLSISSAAEQDIGDGFVAKAKDWRREVDWAEVVVFDDVLGGMGTMADEMRARGKLVIGGSPYSDRAASRGCARAAASRSACAWSCRPSPSTTGRRSRAPPGARRSSSRRPTAKACTSRR